MDTIETQRLVLRRFTRDDADNLYKILSDPMTMAFWPAPFTRDAVDHWLDRIFVNYEENGFGRLAVVLKESGELIGDCGIIHAEIDGNIENDLGYIFFHLFWSRGYATEAATACAAHAMDILQLSRICANMPVDHVASRRIAEKVGMRLEREFLNHRNRDIRTCLYVLEGTVGAPMAG